MNLSNFARGPASARLLFDFGSERGLSSAKLLAGSGLSQAQLADPNVQLTASQELHVAKNLLRLLNFPDGLGLQVGLRYHFSTFGMWGYGLISSATTGEAIDRALRYLPLTSAFTTVTYHEEEDLAVLSFDEPKFEPELRRFLTEREIVAAAVLLHEIAGTGFSLTHFTLKYDDSRSPEVAQAIGRAFQVIPEYRSKQNSLVFRREFLARRLPQANPINASMCEQMCGQLLERRRAQAGATALVRQYLVAAPSSQLPDLETMARVTNISPRTLKRRLQDEGTTFRTLLAEYRAALAKELINDGKLTLTEVAARLGFSDLSSFSQAFKRWYGVPPSAFRHESA